MLKLEKKTQEIKDFVEKVYKIFGCEEARASAVFIEDGKEVFLTSFRTAEPAKVTVNSKGKVEIILRQSRQFLQGMMFNLHKSLIQNGMEESGYLLTGKINLGEFVFLDFTF